MLFPCIDAAEEAIWVGVEAEVSEEGAMAAILKTCGPWTDSSVGWAADDLA
jgi:hypothetical protein